MKNCVILDDYQGVALKYADWNSLTDRFAITSLREHVTDEDALVDRLADADIPDLFHRSRGRYRGMARWIAYPAALSTFTRRLGDTPHRKEAILDPALTIDSRGCVSVAVLQKDRSLLLRPLDSPATGLQWGVLLGLSALFGVTLELLHLPAALLFGAMVAAIVLAMANGAVRRPLSLFFLAQGVLGCLIARSVPLSIFAEIGRNWPIFLLGSP